MQIIKVINNNVISSEDDKGKEIIVMGTDHIIDRKSTRLNSSH